MLSGTESTPIGPWVLDLHNHPLLNGSPSNFHVPDVVSWCVAQEGSGSVLFDDKAVSKSAGAILQFSYITSVRC